MDQKQAQKIFSPSEKVEGFPLAYQKELNIYYMLENTFANRLIELSIGNKFIEEQAKGYCWYLHPEEALYLVSVLEPNFQNKDQDLQQMRQLVLQTIYKNVHPQDINIMHFYLNIRKKNKFCRRIDQFTLKKIKQFSEDHQKIDKFKIFKLYELSEDYKLDSGFRYVMVLDPQDKIAQVLYDEFISKLKIILGIYVLHVCIFSNNDFVFIEVRNM